MPTITLSIVIPVYNERKSINILYGKIKNMLKTFGEKSEIIFLDDGSTDDSYKILQELSSIDENVRVFRHGTNQGQCKAVEKGFREARGETIVTMDGDLQNDPDDIPKLISKLNEGFDVVCGWRWSRKDHWHKVLKSKIGNFFQRKITGLKIHDIGCSMRAYRRRIVKDIIFQNKYEVSLLPLMLSRHTNRITETKIKHYERPFGESKYGFFKMSFGVIRDYIKLLKRLAHE